MQSRVLGYLWWKAWKKEPAFQKELEAEFKIRRSSVCSVVQCLEKRGLLERRSVSTDARQKELVLTDEGMKIQSEVINRLEQMESKMNGWLTPEERSWWIRCINRMETGLKRGRYMIKKLMSYIGEYKRDTLLSPISVTFEVILEVLLAHADGESH